MADTLEVKYDYSDVPTVKAFVRDNSFIKAIKGPYGSGKSSGCVMDIWNRTAKQQPDAQGVRRTRFAIVRGTYQQLKDTTKKTIDEWIKFAKWKESDNTYYISVKLPDGTSIYSEWMLRALDRPDQVDNLLSLELTGAWLNEARELTKEVFDNIQARVGRYPKRSDDGKYGPSWFGVICDTNPPDTDHWWYKFFEEIRPQRCKTCKKITNGVESMIVFVYDKEAKTSKCPKCGATEGIFLGTIFHQPSGRSDNAENRKHLDPNYYEILMIGKDEEWIRVYIDGEYGYIKEGRPVWPNFKDSIHVAREPIKPVKGLPIIIGHDFGITPAVVLTQQLQRGQLIVLDELVTPNDQAMDIEEFTRTRLKPLLATKYMGWDYMVFGDPAGNYRQQNSIRTCFQVLRSYNLKARPAKTNDPQARSKAVNAFLMRSVDGRPAFTVSPTCVTLRKALNGGYHYRRMRVSGEKYSDIADKNFFSHVAEALQYACLGQSLDLFQTDEPSVRRLPMNDNVITNSEAWT